MNANYFDWQLTADWIAALSGIGMLAIATIALSAWKKQLTGTTRHMLAQEVTAACHQLKYAFYGVRSPMIDASEFPPEYYQHGAGHEHTSREQAQGYRHVYGNRWRELWPYIKAVADLRAKAGPLLGDGVAKQLEALAKKARELQFFFSYYCDQIDAGPEAVARWTDQRFIEKTKHSVHASSPPDDEYSRQFDEALAAVDASLKPHLS